MDYLLLILGFALLLISGDWLVRAGIAIATRFNIPKIIVGVTIISVGTSAPELFVSLSATIGGSPDIAVGNIIGSNIANIGLILAISALIISIPIQKSTVRLDFPMLFIATALFVCFIFDLQINRLEGAIMLVVMIAYILIIIRQAKKTISNQNNDIDSNTDKQMKPVIAIIVVIASCTGLVFGSDMMVTGASNIAKALNVSERVISTTVIAFGTSIPELTTSIIASLKKQVDISAGNIIGSNIFNILMIGGVCSVISPLKINPSVMQFDIYFLVGLVLILGLFLLPLKKPIINLYKGVLLLTIYIAYYLILF